MYLLVPACLAEATITMPKAYFFPNRKRITSFSTKLAIIMGLGTLGIFFVKLFSYNKVCTGEVKFSVGYRINDV